MFHNRVYLKAMWQLNGYMSLMVHHNFMRIITWIHFLKLYVDISIYFLHVLTCNFFL